MSRGANRATSVAALRMRLVSLDPRTDIISFDIFDTLVQRRIGPPEQIKNLAARIASDTISESGLSVPADELVRMRRDAEAPLRRISLAGGNDHECRFEQIASDMAAEIVRRHGDSPSAEGFEAAILDSEARAEDLVLIAMPGMVELVAELQAVGFRLLAISDMYLSAEFLAARLAGLGYRIDAAAIYVSGDVGLGKYSGRLFRHVAMKERIDLRHMIHVGDNPHSDRGVPLSLGIRAILLDLPVHRRQSELRQARRWLAERNVYWRGAQLFAEIPASTEDDFFTCYGHDVLGPIFSVFVARLGELMHERRIDRVFFLAREGDLFQRIHAQFEGRCRASANALPNRYLYVSRKAVALPAAHRGLAAERLVLYSTQASRRGLAGLADALGIPLADLARASPSPGWDPLDGKSGLLRPDWAQELADSDAFQELLCAAAAPPRADLRRYLEQEGFFGSGQRVALVDIGWSGSIQRALKDAFGDDVDWPEVHGFYLSFNDHLGHGLGQDEATGILFDRRRFHPRHDTLSHFEELFENGARAPHPSTVGYAKQADGKVMPLFRAEDTQDRTAERAFNDISQRLRGGVLDFAKEFADRYPLYGYPAADLVPYVAELARRAVFFPTRQEAEHLLQMVHAEDAGTDAVLDFSRYRLPGPSMALRPLALLAAIRGSHWKYGTGRTLGIPGFNLLLRLAHRIILARNMSRGRPHCPFPYSLPHGGFWERGLLWLVCHGALPWLVRLRDALWKK